MLYVPQSLKMCSKCGEWKPATTRYFYRREGHRLRTECEDCRYIYNRNRYHTNKEQDNARSRQYREANRQRIAEKNREYRQANKHHLAEKDRQYRQANKQRILEREHIYREANREHKLKHMRQYYIAHKQCIAEKVQKYRQTESGKAVDRAKHAKRKAQKLAIGGTHTATDIRHQYDAQQGRCYYCEIEVGDKYHVDHFMPLAKGGSNAADNIVIACPTCNMRKRDKLPDVFLAELKRSKHD